MAELNPYESPTTLQHNKLPTAAVKKAVGFMTLAILTPIAVFVAGFIGCQAVEPVVNLIALNSGGWNFDDPQFPIISMIAAGCAVSFIPPIMVLAVMGRWAIIAYKREAAERSAKPKAPPDSG